MPQEHDNAYWKKLTPEQLYTLSALAVLETKKIGKCW